MMPTISHDTAFGLATWPNYVNGGTWNTVARADPENIANTIEVAVTWWPPGQYLPVALLQSSGLSLGIAALFVTFFSILSLGIGGAVLIRELGGENRILPWVSAAFSCSYYALLNFHQFIGGEIGLMAVLPWIILFAWKFRNRTTLLALISPVLFLCGSFIKHSFAIHSICIIIFLWFEKIRGIPGPSKGIVRFIKNSITANIPLFTVSIVYILLRNYFIDTTVSPTTQAENKPPLFSLLTYLGYSAWAPLFTPWGIGSLMERFANKFFELSSFRLWEHLGPFLSVLSPLPVGLYAWLSFRKNPLIRLAGVTALFTTGIHFYIYHTGGVIGLRDRYYQFPALLFLAVAASQLFKTGWRMHVSRLVLASGIFIGSLTLVERIFAMKSWVYYNSEMNISTGVPSGVRQELRLLAKGSENCILAIHTPILEVELFPICSPTTRLLALYHQQNKDQLFYGRAPLIIMAYPKTEKRNYIAYFADYTEDEWETYEIEDWIFLKAITEN